MKLVIVDKNKTRKVGLAVVGLAVSLATATKLKNRPDKNKKVGTKDNE